MKARVLLPLALVAAFTLASCENFDPYSNLFKNMGLGQVSSGELAKKDSATITKEAYSSDGSVSESFIDSLAKDETSKATVLKKLKDSYGSEDKAAVQNSAALAASIEIQTVKGAGEIVDNILKVASVDLSKSTSSEIKATLTSLIPASIASDAVSFKAAISALVSAKSDYDVLGNSIGTDKTVEGSINVGSAAQSALVATVIEGIKYSGVINPTTGKAYTSQADLLWDLAQPGSTVAISSNDITQPSTTLGTPLGNLLAAANLSAIAGSK